MVEGDEELHSASACILKGGEDPTIPITNPDCVAFIALCKLRPMMIQLMFVNIILALYLNRNDWSQGIARPNPGNIPIQSPEPAHIPP